MLIIKANQYNTLVVTVSQNSELTNPEYLFSFTHIFTKRRVTFIPTDISTHKSRYDEFEFVEGQGAGKVDFGYEGQWLYSIWEQPNGSGNLDPALATNVVENGLATVYVSSAMTDESNFDFFISPDEDNSNYIFAPDELNPGVPVTPSQTPSNTPTPSITPTITLTPSQTATNTPTPSITPTFTPTPSNTPSVNVNPLTYGALWWIDFTDSGTLTISSGSISQALDKISNVSFTSNNGPFYNSTGYLSVSGTAQEGGERLRNTLGTYTTPFSGWTWFCNMYDNPTQQGGGKIFNFSQGDDPVGPNQAGHFQDDLGSPGVAGWRSRSVSNDVSFLNVSQNPTLSAWTFVAIRAYQDGSDMKLDFYENGSILQTGTLSSKTMKTLTDAQFNLMYDGGIDYVTEQFFFSSKLSDTAMSDMFGYLSNKYPLQ